MTASFKDERGHLYYKTSAVYSELKQDGHLPKRYRMYQREDDEVGDRLESMILELDQVLKIA